MSHHVLAHQAMTPASCTLVCSATPPRQAEETCLIMPREIACGVVLVQVTPVNVDPLMHKVRCGRTSPCKDQGCVLM